MCLFMLEWQNVSLNDAKVRQICIFLFSCGSAAAAAALTCKPSGLQIHGRLTTNCGLISASHNFYGRPA